MAKKEDMQSIGTFTIASISLSELRKVWKDKLVERRVKNSDRVECFVPRKDYEKPIKPRKEKTVLV